MSKKRIYDIRIRSNIIFSLLILISVFLCSCRGNMISSGIDDPKDNDDSTNGEICVIKWAVPDYFDGKADYLNELLESDGKCYRLEFDYINSDSYNDSLESILNSGEDDIVFMGFGGTPTDYAGMITNGLLYELSDYLENNGYMSINNDEIWNVCRYNDGIYAFPNQAKGMYMDYCAIDKSVFPGISGEVFDILSFLDSASEADYVNVGYPVIYMGGRSADGVAYSIYNASVNGVFVDLKTGEVTNPFENDRFTELLTSLETLKNNGIVVTINDSDKLEKVLNKGDFAAVLFLDVSKDLFDETLYEIQKLPFTVEACMTGSTAVSAASDNKDLALELLGLLYTDSNYANALVYGNPTSYTVIDGTVTQSSGYFMNSIFLGIADNVYANVSDIYSGDKRAVKDAFVASGAYTPFIYSGYITEDKSVIATGISLEKLITNAVEDSLKGKVDIEAYRERFKSLGGDDVLKYYSGIFRR